MNKFRDFMLKPLLQAKIIILFFIATHFCSVYFDTSFILSLFEPILLIYFFVNTIFLFFNRKNLPNETIKKNFKEVLIFSIVAPFLGKLFGVIIFKISEPLVKSLIKN